MLSTVQPVTNLQNYNKNITPVLKSNKSIILTKNGKMYCKISTPKQSREEERNKTFIANLFVKYIHKLGKEKSYSLSQAERMIKES